MIHCKSDTAGGGHVGGSDPGGGLRSNPTLLDADLKRKRFEFEYFIRFEALFDTAKPTTWDYVDSSDGKQPEVKNFVTPFR